MRPAEELEYCGTAVIMMLSNCSAETGWGTSSLGQLGVASAAEPRP